MSITPLIAGNWKMNGLGTSMTEVRKLAGLLGGATRPDCTIVICPPATILAALSALAAPAGILTGGQDCHPERSGAHTGDIAAEMLTDAGAGYVIVGHSERRIDHGEDDALVRSKALAALRAGLVPIVCVGETRAEREAAAANDVVEQQLAASLPDIEAGARVVVAYEPVWAIGTGLTPTAADIAQMHGHIRRLLENRFVATGSSVPILYGGSLKPGNAREILAIEDVDGGLIGGASLLADDFFAIISAL